MPGITSIRATTTSARSSLTEAYYALLKGDRARCHEKLRSGLPRSRYDLSKRTLRMHPMMLSRLFAEALTAGIEVEYARQSIRALQLRPPSRDAQNWPWPLRVYTFGQFEVQRDGRPLEYSRKAPKKTIALLKAIIAYGGTNVPEQKLIDAFWSDEEAMSRPNRSARRCIACASSSAMRTPSFNRPTRCRSTRRACGSTCGRSRICSREAMSARPS